MIRYTAGGESTLKSISGSFVHKLYEMSRSAVPERVMQKARECLIDYIGCAIGGGAANLDRNRAFLERNGFQGAYHVIRQPEKADLRTAVMLNAFNAHTLELDDSHRTAMTHLGAPIFSALLGVAEQDGSDTEQLLRAAVVGYEAAICLANSVQPGHKMRGFHVSGTCCTAGCAMGVAALRAYSEEEMNNAFSAAVTSAAGLLAVISGRSEQKPYNIANAAVSGLNAALYGAGFSGAVDILGDERGFFRAETDESHADRLFSAPYAIEGIYQKLYAACRHCHAPMEAMLKLMDRHDISPDDVSEIVVDTYGLAIQGHDHSKIEGVSSAKQSIPYGVAAACRVRDCGIAAFSSERIADAELLKLTEKVTVREDPELTALLPDRRAAKLRVVLRDGRSFDERVDYPKGEPENPLTARELREKFIRLAEFGGYSTQEARLYYEFLSQLRGERAAMIFDRR